MSALASPSIALRPDRDGLVAALAARQLDRTLTSALPPVDPRDEQAVGATGLLPFDAGIGGGWPRGQLSELVGPSSSGRTSLWLRTLAAATARGEVVALVDALDQLDVASADAAGVDLTRLLWIRGHVVTSPGLCRDLNQRAMDQAIKALTLVLQAGKMGVVVFDVSEAPAEALKRLPFTTWLRLQRMVEGSQTTCLLVGREPMARSSAGLTVTLNRDGASARLRIGRPPSPVRAPHVRMNGRLFDGLDIRTRVIRARSRFDESAVLSLRSDVRHG